MSDILREIAFQFMPTTPPDTEPHPLRETIARGCAVNFRHWLGRTTHQTMSPWGLMSDEDKQRFLDEADRILKLMPKIARWKPIDTAPRDGTDMLLTDGVTVSQGGWTSDMDYGADYEGQLNCAGWWSTNGNLTHQLTGCPSRNP